MIGSSLKGFSALFSDTSRWMENENAAGPGSTSVLPSRPLPLTSTGWPEVRSPPQDLSPVEGGSSTADRLPHEQLGFLPIPASGTAAPVTDQLSSVKRTKDESGLKTKKKKKNWAKRPLRGALPDGARLSLAPPQGFVVPTAPEHPPAQPSPLDAVQEIKKALDAAPEPLPGHLLEWVRNSFQPSHDRRTLLVSQLRTVLHEARGVAGEEGAEGGEDQQQQQQASTSEPGPEDPEVPPPPKTRPSLHAALSNLSELERLIDEQHRELVRKGLLDASDQAEVDRLMRIARLPPPARVQVPPAPQILEDLERLARELETTPLSARTKANATAPVADKPTRRRSSTPSHPGRVTWAAEDLKGEDEAALVQRSDGRSSSHAASRGGSLSRHLAEQLLGEKDQDLDEYLRVDSGRPREGISLGEWSAGEVLHAQKSDLERPTCPTPRRSTAALALPMTPPPSHGKPPKIHTRAGAFAAYHQHSLVVDEDEPSHVYEPSPRPRPLSLARQDSQGIEGLADRERGVSPGFWLMTRPSAPTPKRAMGTAAGSGFKRSLSEHVDDEFKFAEEDEEGDVEDV